MNESPPQLPATQSEGEPHFPVIDLDADPEVPKGWMVEEHQKGGKFAFDTTTVSVAIPKQFEGIQPRGGFVVDPTPEDVAKLFQRGSQQVSKVSVETILKELKGMPVLNANVFYFLRANPHLIPEDWKSKSVHFFGTIYRDKYGKRCARVIDLGGVFTWEYIDRSWAPNEYIAMKAESQHKLIAPPVSE